MKLDQKLLSKEEAAAYLGISFSKLNQLIKTGELVPVRLGPKSIRFTIDSLNNPLPCTTPLK
jgi:excisionase family DNA binding protein